jgi:hypothetical protein
MTVNLEEDMNFIPTEIDLKVILLILSQKAWERIFGLMGKSTMDNG